VLSASLRRCFRDPLTSSSEQCCAPAAHLSLQAFYKASGLFLEKSLKAYLQDVRDSELPERNLRYIETMLPLSLVDDDHGKLRAVTSKISILKTNSRSTNTDRNKLIEYLQNEKADLEVTEPH
jgi:hypothetical protein